MAETAARLHQLAAQQFGWARTDLDALVQRLALGHTCVAGCGSSGSGWTTCRLSWAGAWRQRVREAQVRHASLHSTWRRLRPAQQLARRGEALTRLGRRLRERLRSDGRSATSG